MPKWSLFASLPVLQLATHTPQEIESAKKHLRQELHHIGADGNVVEEFVEKLIQEMLADTDNQHQLEDWTETIEIANGWCSQGVCRDDVISHTFLSPEFKIGTGEAHFTLNSMYKVPVPKGDYVILNQTWRIVGDDGVTLTPLNKMYNHHWLIGDDDNPLDLCEGDYFFGGGAEYRKMDYTFPAGYGQGRVNATGQCGANLHFISTEDLATQWEGFNHPDGNHGAAMKLACECGYEPGRAEVCKEWGDGSFACCFTGSRALVNHPEDTTKRSHRLRVTFEYVRDFSTTKHLQCSLLDVGGNSRTEHGQSLSGIEWSVDSYLNNEGAYTRCNETVCSAVRSQVVGDGSKFGYGICSGEMLWGYMHMHAGGSLGTMAINGKEYCTSLPVVGTDPENPWGNEQGFLVGVTECVDNRELGNKVRLEKGDVVTLTQHYDVDPASQRHFPMPGGKHGGIMGLFFAFMDCDAGSYGEVYVRRNDTCVPVPHQKRGRVGEFFDTKEQCEAGEPSQEVDAVPESQELVPEPEPELESGLFDKMNLVWRDCGGSSKVVNFTGLSASTVTIGKTNKIQAFGQLSSDITAANLTVKLASGAAGLVLASYDGEVCSESHDQWTLLDQIHLKPVPLGCPLAPGDFAGEFDVFISPLIPANVAHTTITLVGHMEDQELYCLEMVTTLGDSPFQEIVVV